MVSLDPLNAQEGKVTLREESRRRLGLTSVQSSGDETLTVLDELTGRTHRWGEDGHVTYASSRQGGTPAAHIFTVRPTEPA